MNVTVAPPKAVNLTVVGVGVMPDSFSSQAEQVVNHWLESAQFLGETIEEEDTDILHKLIFQALTTAHQQGRASEREECAKVAENMACESIYYNPCDQHQRIADSIRGRG